MDGLAPSNPLPAASGYYWRPAIQEEELITRILAGDKELYAELVRAHQDHLYQLCRAVLSDPDLAEDAAQVAFIKAYRGLAGFRRGSSLRTWLTRIALNQCKDVLRQRRRHRLFSLDALLEGLHRVPEPLIFRPAEDLPGAAALPEERLAGLCPGERKVVDALRDDPDASYEELARRLGLSVNGIKGRLKRARQKARPRREDDK